VRRTLRKKSGIVKGSWRKAAGLGRRSGLRSTNARFTRLVLGDDELRAEVAWLAVLLAHSLSFVIVSTSQFATRYATIQHPACIETGIIWPSVLASPVDSGPVDLDATNCSHKAEILAPTRIENSTTDRPSFKILHESIAYFDHSDFW
jgi:hypothetical protein